MMLNDLKSEPLSKRAWARLFKVDRSAVDGLLRRYGAESVGDGYPKWRIPLRHCPPCYLIDAGIIQTHGDQIKLADFGKGDVDGSE